MSRFASLNKLGNLQNRAYKADGRRKVGDGKDDPIGEKLAKTNDAASAAEVAAGYGVPEARIIELGRKAPNFGQFRMTIGNLMRGAVSRKRQADEAGVRMSLEAAGDPEAFRATMKEHKARERSERTGRPVKSKSTGKAKKADPDRVPIKQAMAGKRGAPSKQEAARRGKGTKKSGRGKRAGRIAAAEGLPQQGDGEAAAQWIAEEVAPAGA